MKAPLKASDWWSYKIPPLLAIAYCALSLESRPRGFMQTGVEIGLYLLAIIGIAGFGHVFLDAFDVEEDRLLGKPNLWAPLDNFRRALLIVLLLAAAWIPFLFLPIGRAGLSLVGLQFLSFVLYAVPPIRLKGRGLAGAAADAMYAHALPAMWTWILFSRISGARAQWWPPVLIGTWALAVGMRHMLQHQALEVANDRRAGVATYAATRGIEAAHSLIMRVLLPLEVASFLLLLAIVSVRIPVVAAGFVLFLLWHLIRARSAPAGESAVVRSFILSRFYEKWLPLLVLAGLALNDPAWLVVLVMHAAVFRGAPRGERGAARYAAARGSVTAVP